MEFDVQSTERDQHLWAGLGRVSWANRYRPDRPQQIPREMGGPLPTSLRQSLDMGTAGGARCRERQLCAGEGDPADTDS